MSSPTVTERVRLRETVRREWVQVAAVIAASVLARALLFNHVGIWGDYGFYIYDSRLILQGQTPFVDFLGRSPLFNYAFAYARGMFGHPIPLLRVFISVFWLATIVPVFAIARRVHSHRAGLIAGLLMGVSPFALVYGMWANTQSLAAVLAAVATYAAIRAERDGWFLGVGFLFGLAYLSRRSVFVIAGGIGLWLAYRWWRDRDTGAFVRRCIGMGVGGGAALLVVYGAMVGFNPGRTWALFEVHTINLFISYGRGGYPLLGSDAPIVTNSIDDGRIPIFNDLCQTCGAWTARTFAKTLLVAFPSCGILFYYWRDWTNHYFGEAGRQYLGGIVGALGVYAAVRAAMAGFYLRVGLILAIALFVIVAYRSDPLSRDVLYQRELAAVLLILVGLASGYLYRNRVLHTYYFMDFWPFLSVVAGVLYAEAWPGLRTTLRYTLVIAIILSTVVGFGAAHPLTVVALEDNEDGWFTIGNLHDYKQDINARTKPGDLVITSSPAFLSDTHAKTLNDNPRLHMVAARYGSGGPAAPMYRDMVAAMRSGEAEYVIYTRTMRQMLLWNASARTAFTRHYCRVESADSLYQRSNGLLYRHQPQDCPPDQQPVVNTSRVGATVNPIDQVAKGREGVQNGTA